MLIYFYQKKRERNRVEDYIYREHKWAALSCSLSYQAIKKGAVIWVATLLSSLYSRVGKLQKRSLTNVPDANPTFCLVASKYIYFNVFLLFVSGGNNRFLLSRAMYSDWSWLLFFTKHSIVVPLRCRTKMKKGSFLTLHGQSLPVLCSDKVMRHEKARVLKKGRSLDHQKKKVLCFMKTLQVPTLPKKWKSFTI